MAPRLQRVRLKDIEKSKSAESSSTSQQNGSFSGGSQSPFSPASQTKSSSLRAGPTLVKLGSNGTSSGKIEHRTVLRMDELTKDGRRLHKRELDISDLSPVKRKREALERSRTVVTWEPIVPPLSETLQGILQGFSDSGFEYVPDTRALPSVEYLMGAAAAKHSKRRYLSTVMSLFLMGVAYTD